MRLFIHDPLITSETIRASYTHDSTRYEHTFTLPAHARELDATVVRVARWLAVIHACYLFSIEYFTELETDFPLSDTEISFLETTIFHGMAEFRYVNTLPIDLATTLIAPSAPEAPATSPSSPTLEGRLLLNGGGKDGLVSAGLLRESGIDFDLFQIGTGAAQSQAARALGKTPVVFRRNMEQRRFEGKYEGHRPTSAAIAIAAVLTAYLTGKRDVIASNESSANEATLDIDGITINHQYSKSFEFEAAFNELMRAHDIDVRYFSLLRPLHEVQIVKLLASYPELSAQFISCNHGFRRGYWCMKCAKCAFISLVATAISPELASNALKSEHPLTTPALLPHIAALVDPVITKPLECVGTLMECQVAAKLILDNSDATLTPELSDLFARTTTHVTPEHIASTLHHIDTHHLIPREGYDAVLTQMSTKLQVA